MKYYWDLFKNSVVADILLAVIIGLTLATGLLLELSK